jgi:predicted permease
MAIVREWIARVWGTLRPARPDADLERELRAHLELAGGTARPEVQQAMDALRDQRGVPWLDDLLRDLRYGARVLRRQRTFAAVALLTVAIGIGATTAVFSVVNSVLLRPLPYADPESLVAVWHTAPGAPGLADVSGDLRLSPSMYFTYAEHTRAFRHIGIWTPMTATVTGAGEPEQVRTLLITDGVLDALAVPPVVGRWLSPGDQVPTGPRRVVLSHGYWLRRFGGDDGVIGRALVIDGRAHEVVGVMPAGFRVVDTDADLILPLPFDRSQLMLAGFGFRGVARLRPGTTIAEATADVGRMVPIWMRSWPAAEGVNPRIYERFRITPSIRPLHAEVVGSVGRVLWVLMGTIGIVLSIACANVATLLLVRAESRQQELAVRASLGAGRGRILRGLVVESLVLAVCGGILGVAMAYGGLRLLVALGPADLPRLADISVDLRSLALAAAVSLASGLFFGLIPAFRHGGLRVQEALRGGGRTASDGRDRQRARNVLVVVQVALALVLLVSSGLMIRTSLALRSVAMGFTGPASLQTVRIAIPETVVAEPERVARTQQRIAERFAAIPGVTSVGSASVMHLEGLGTPWDAIQREGATVREGDLPPMRVFKRVTPGLFRTTGTRVLAGRDYAWEDLYGRRPVVILSENLARELWGGAREAIGKRVRTLLPGAPWQEVIGVVDDVRDNGAHRPAPAIVYWPLLGDSLYGAKDVFVARAVTFALRTDRAGSEALLRELKEAVWSVQGGLPLASPRTMQESIDQSMGRTSFTLVMLSLAGGVALVLGLVGISGVIAFAVSQRRREIGIRLAIGAGHGELTRMFLRSAFQLSAVGIVTGLVVAAGVTRLMAALLFDVTPLDPATYASVALALLAAALGASYLPARRVASVDPAEALKAE